MNLKKSVLFWLAIVLSAATISRAQQAPDLTVGTTRLAVLTNISYRAYTGKTAYTYNLGPTGLRGWIYSYCLPSLDNYTSYAPFQILVTSVGANTPAVGILQTNDVILGVAVGLPPVSLFTNDTRVTMGNAITAAESGDGKLSFLVNRYGVSSNLTLTIQLGITNMSYSATAPYNCPKSALILSNALNVISRNLGGNAGGSQALALLASGNTNYLPQVQSYARSVAPANLVVGWPLKEWNVGYSGLWLSEYYLLTQDAQVTNALTQLIGMLAKSDTMWGCYGHAGAKVLPYHVAAGVHGYGAGYGPVNACGLLCKLAMAVAQKTGIPSIVNDPEFQPALDRSINFYGYYVQKGNIPYGEMSPYWSNQAANGKDGLAALFFGVLGDKPTQAQYFTRLSVASHHMREWGHNGSGWGLCWEQLGTVMGSTNAAAAYSANTRWYQELARRSDGSFAYDCPGDSPSTAANYWDYEGYDILDPTAWNALFLSAPQQALYITGKNANPTNYLTDAAASNAVWAGLYDLNLPSYSTNQLIAHLGEYQPTVRYAAAQQLASLCLSNASLNSALVPTLIALTTNANPGVRSAVCSALATMQCTNALNALAARMYDTNVWVRHNANWALDQLGTAALPQLTNIMTAFTTYASPDPLVKINWDDDPCGFANGGLAHLLFVTLATSTINQSTNLLYPAIIAGLRQPERGNQGYVGSFIKNQLQWKDVQALASPLMTAGTRVAQADPMGGMGGPAGVLACLAKYGVNDGLAALAVMTDSGFATDPQTTLDLGPAYQTYGTEASQLLPTLYNMETTTSFYAKYVSMLQSNNNNLPAVHSFKQFTSASATPSALYISAATNVALSVTATNLGGGLRYKWSLAQGPGTVSFSNPTNATCTASFSTPGVYVLQAGAAPIMDRNLFWDPSIPGGAYIYGKPIWTFNTWTNFYGADYTNVTVTVIGGLPAVNNAGGAILQTGSSATLQGLLTAGVGANVWVCWGDNDAGSNSTSVWDHVQAAGIVSQGTVFSVPVTGLTSNTTYFYRLFVNNGDGQAWSAVASSFSAAPAGASKYGMKISFTNYNRAETLTNFPALVVFSNGMAGATFNFSTFISTNGYDLRFTDSTGLTNLNYEIENWSSSGSTAYVWVQVPRFTSNCCIWAKWGDILQTNQLACTTNGAAWDNTFKGVWHFPSGASLTARDSTSNRNNGTVVSATATTGVIGGGMNATTTQYIDLLNNNNSLYISSDGDWSMQAWAKPSASIQWVNLVNVSKCGIEGEGTSRWGLLQDDVIVARADTGPDYSFQHVMATRSGTTYKMYINGSLQSGGSGDNNYGLGGTYRIGQGFYKFAGSIDEVRIEGVARSPNWVWACYMNMASNSFFNTPDTVLLLSSSPIANFAPTSITTNSATLNAALSATNTNYAVTVYWGTTDVGTNAGAWAHNASVGSWTNVALTNITYQAANLLRGTTYYYAFRATNATTSVWATPSWQFSTLTNISPVASFTANTMYGVAPLPVTFTDTSTGGASIAWAWDFQNNGSTDSTAQNPTTTFSSVGAYSVKLTVSNAIAMSSLIKTNYIIVLGSPAVDNAGGVTNQTVISTTLQGRLTTGGAANAWICWGDHDAGVSSTSSWNNVQAVGSVIQGNVFTATLTGLAANKTYFYRCFVSNAAGAAGQAWSSSATSFSPPGFMATSSDGTVTNYTLNGTNYTSHIFTDTTGAGTFVPMTSGNVEVLVVGGGGGGGSPGTSWGAGGGAGGLIYTNSYFVTASTYYSITVGAGGAAGTSTDSAGGNGQNSGFGSLIALGGGGGGGYTGAGASGGSGGGSYGGTVGSGLQPGSSSGGYGNNGGVGSGVDPGGGGGGGAGAVGDSGGAGGSGLNYGISGVSTWYAGGGNGAGNYAPVLGGGGNQGNNGTLKNGVDNTGGGGAGSWKRNTAGNGGSGIVIVRYVSSSAIQIQNLAPSGIATNAATLNAVLSATDTNYDVTAYWGTTNGGTNAGAWMYSASVGSYANVDSTNITYQATGLSGGTTYYYAFLATNATASIWAQPSWQFSTLGAPPPVANFTASATYGVAPLTVTFTDTSTGEALNAWAWDFKNDGTTDSTAQNPVTTFSAGIYSVKLTAANGSGMNSLVKTNYITVVEIPAVNNAGGATNQTLSSATLQGQLTAGTLANAWICWGDHDAGTSSTSAWNNVQAVGSVNQGTVFTVPVTGLASNMNYFYRCFVTNTVGQAWSASAISFSTRLAYSIGGVIATSSGGTVTNYTLNGTNYTAHIFTNSGTLSVTVGGNVDLLVVGGGGGGGGGINGVVYSYGGGGGQVLSVVGLALAAGNNNVVVGAGGIGVGNGTAPNGTGKSSSFAGYTALGGGTPVNGSGVGGASGSSMAGGAKNGSAAGGGGGDSSVGQTAPSGTAGGAGGTGTVNYLLITTNYYGGGGGGQASTTQGSGGLGGGGAGGVAGTANTGGGGGGSANGGSGIVIVRYLSGFGVILNLAPSGITTNAASLNAALSAASTNYAVTVYWGTTNGGTNAGAWMYSASVGSYTNVAFTNIAYQATALSGGTTYYYAFRATNATTSVWATPSWQFSTLGVTTPVANFTASTTYGVASLTVNFTDTSTGSPTSWYWNFGDGGTLTNQNPSHTYAAGVWLASLIASNANGASSPSTKTITVITQQQSAWQSYYGVLADSSDPLGKGISNYNQFLAGFNPTNAAAYPRIISIVKTNSTGILITYRGSNGDNSYTGGPATRTNILEYTTGTALGGFTNNFSATQTNILSGGVGSGIVTNFFVPNALTHTSMYFRVRVLTP